MLWLVAFAAAAPTAATVPVVVASAPQQQVVVRFEDEVVADAAGVRSPEGTAPLGLDAVRTHHALRFRPLLADDAGLRRLESRVHGRVGRRPALRGWVAVEAPAGANLAAVATALRSVEGVRYAYVQGSGWPPPGDIPPVTEDFRELQDWLDADPGIDAAWAHARGLSGADVAVADCEYGWNTAHEDLVDHPLGLEAGQTVPAWVAEYTWDQHGTAAIGALVAGDDGYGTRGAVPDATVTTWPEVSEEEGERRVQAIANAVAAAAPGDVVVLEMQDIVRPEGSYGPAELDPAVWEVVRAATDAGVIVVAAAGNGTEDLDSAWYAQNYAAWGDSGAILVGAGSPDVAHDAMDYSTYGTRVNLQGWGYAVFTPGYGDVVLLRRDMDQAYTFFSGTSAATPVVAAAVLLVQDFRVGQGLPPLGAVEMRLLLQRTGRPQGGGGQVGPLPDVRAAMAAYDADEDGVIAASLGGLDCDDADAAVHPGVPDADEPPGVDLNCDGEAPPPTDTADTADTGDVPPDCGCGGSAGVAIVAGWFGSGMLAARRSHARRLGPVDRLPRRL